MTLLAKGSLLQHLTVIDGKLISCGYSNQTIDRAGIASCFSFDGMTGALTGHYMLPWKSTTALSTLVDARGNLRLLISGDMGFPPKSYTTICEVYEKRFDCGGTLISDTVGTGSLWNENTRAILSVGSLLVASTLTVFNVDGDVLRSYSYSSSQLYSFRFAAVSSVLGFSGTCVAGINTKVDGSQQIVIGWSDGYRSIKPPLILSLAIGRITNAENLVQCAILVPKVFRTIVGGGIDLNDGRGIQPYIIRADTFRSTIQFGIRYVAFREQHGYFSDMVLVENQLFVIADMTELAPSAIQKTGVALRSAQHHLLVMVIDATTGIIVNQVRVSGPGDVVCSKILLAHDRLHIACSIRTWSGDVHGLLFSVDKQLTFQDLPQGYERAQVHDFIAETLSVTTAIVSQQGMHSEQVTLEVKKVYFSTAPGSLAQVVTSSPPTARPTTVTPSSSNPTTLQPVKLPTAQPSTEPTSHPTARPTISASPTSIPSSSVPTSTHKPTEDPSSQPSSAPSFQPSSSVPSKQLSSCVPSEQPSSQELALDSTAPPRAQSSQPTQTSQSMYPSIRPVAVFTTQPNSQQPLTKPTASPTQSPSVEDSIIYVPTAWPTFPPPHSAKAEEKIPTYALILGVTGGCLLLGLLGMTYIWVWQNEAFLQVAPSDNEGTTLSGEVCPSSPASHDIENPPLASTAAPATYVVSNQLVSPAFLNMQEPILLTSAGGSSLNSEGVSVSSESPSGSENESDCSKSANDESASSASASSESASAHSASASSESESASEDESANSASASNASPSESEGISSLGAALDVSEVSTGGSVEELLARWDQSDEELENFADGEKESGSDYEEEGESVDA